MVTIFVSAGAALALLSVLIFFWLNRPKINKVDSLLPMGFEEEGFSHESFLRLLEQFVDVEGRVDYAAWHQSKAAVTTLTRYIAAIQRYSPDNSPERFGSVTQQTTYWINAYNALVIFALLKRWPLASVLDVKAPIEAVKGMGFFYVQQHIVGGRAISLHALEHKKLLEAGADPRVHFLLNCGTGSCPMLRPISDNAVDMETLYKEAATAFVSDPEHVKIDHSNKVITLSRIFKWYMEDFTKGQADQSSPRQRRLLSFIMSVAPFYLVTELERATSYQLKFKPFNWKVNAAT